MLHTTPFKQKGHARLAMKPGMTFREITLMKKFNIKIPHLVYGKGIFRFLHYGCKKKTL